MLPKEEVGEKTRRDPDLKAEEEKREKQTDLRGNRQDHDEDEENRDRGPKQETAVNKARGEERLLLVAGDRANRLTIFYLNIKYR